MNSSCWYHLRRYYKVLNGAGWAEVTEVDNECQGTKQRALGGPSVYGDEGGHYLTHRFLAGPSTLALIPWACGGVGSNTRWPLLYQLEQQAAVAGRPWLQVTSVDQIIIPSPGVDETDLAITKSQSLSCTKSICKRFAQLHWNHPSSTYPSSPSAGADPIAPECPCRVWQAGILA